MKINLKTACGLLSVMEMKLVTGGNGDPNDNDCPSIDMYHCVCNGYYVGCLSIDLCVWYCNKYPFKCSL